MKATLLFLAVVAFAVFPACGQAPWVIMPGTPVYGPDYLFEGVITQFISPQPNVFWGAVVETSAGGPGSRSYRYKVFGTANGGQTWAASPGLLSTYTNGTFSGLGINDLSAIDAQKAWMLVSNSTTTTLYQTTTGPAGFVPMANALPARFSKIHCFNATTAIAVANMGPGSTTLPIYRTTDGGVTWTVITNPTILAAGTASGISVADKVSLGSNLWMNTYFGSLIRTTDAGLTWTVVPQMGPPPSGTPVSSLTFEDALNGMAIYYNNARALHYIRTTDGGLSWTEVVFTGQPGYNRVVALTGLPGTYLSTDFRYPGASNLTSGRIVISRDHGSSWQNLYTNVISGAVSRIVVVSPTEIWAGVDAPGYQLNEPMAMRFAGTLLSGRVATPALRVAGYPNPTTGLVELQGEMAGEEGVCVYDALGRLCQQDKVSPSRRTVDLSKQTAGIYHLVITGASGLTRHLRVSKL